MDRRRFLGSVLAAGSGLGGAIPLRAEGKGHLEGVSSPDNAASLQQKIENFDQDFEDDVFLDAPKMLLLQGLLQRLNRLQQVLGFGHFNLLSFDDMLKAAARTPAIGAFLPAEIALTEEIFFADARRYGFYGEKVTQNLTQRIPAREAIKISGSGHYLFRGRPEAVYRQIVQDVGSDVILTSGIRSVVKQLHLFLAKTALTRGNLSRASRSLAPPGHSFHGISDFDVGKLGWGYRNFTDQFAETEVYRRLIDLGYVKIRYTRTNTYGVRFEPWHIMVSA